MKLFTVFWQYDNHEMENEVFASETGTAKDARKYLMQVHGGEDGYISDLGLLKDITVHPFTTVHASNGDPYAVKIA